MTSNYTPPNLVTPTSGGNTGDGSLKGKLTVQANTAPPTANSSTTNLLEAYNTGQPLIFTYVNSSGIAWTVLTGPASTENVAILSKPPDTSSLDGKGGDEAITYLDNFVVMAILQATTIYPPSYYHAAGADVAGVGLVLSPLFGLDNRTGLTAADSSTTTLYTTTTAASQVYRVTARVFGVSGTISSAVYTIGWTEGGTSMTETVSISAVSTLDSQVFLLQPDNDTTITAKLTTLSGTSPKVNVTATVEQMA
jgi:hypothetical protein